MEKFKRKRVEEEKVRLEEAYDEFRETFEEGIVKVSKTFIRGDIVNPDKMAKNSKNEGTKLSLYKPSPLIQLKPLKTTSTLESAKKMAQETAKKIMKQADVTTDEQQRPLKSGTKKVAEKSRLTNLEAFKEELKKMQEMRDERKGLRQQLKERLGVPEEELNRIAPSLDAPYAGSGFPSSNLDFENDPSTTNLYVCNLPADAKMEDLFETYGTFGPLASAKMLYPKPDEERHRSTLSGFVAFMSRLDAERALCAMHGEVMRGCEMRVSWARPVVIPPLPFYVPPPLRELAMPDAPSGLPFNAKPLTEELRTFLHKYKDLPKLNCPLASNDYRMIEEYKKMVENATVRVVIPTEKPLLHLIHRVVEFLVRAGPLFEAVLMARERQNPMYRFLFDNHHPTHVYYRWKLYSVLQGDDRLKWRLDKFKMFDGGSWWQPPPHSLFEHGMPSQLYDTAYQPKHHRIRDRHRESRRRHHRDRDDSRKSSTSEDEEERRERRKNRLKKDMELEEKQRKMKGILSEIEREELEDILRGLTPEKIVIGDATIWCLDHAECSKEITECIYESLCIKETPLHKKIARIYLVTDILANCSVRIKDAFYYRQHFGDYLQKIFIELNETLESIESRIKTEQFRQRVMLCFRNWEDHAVYPTHDLIQWQNIFLGLLKTGAETDSSIDGEPLPPEDDEDMREDIDGIPIADDDNDDGIGMAIEGQPEMDPDPDLDGVPLDEFTEIEIKKENQSQEDNRFTTGSWSAVETELPPVKTKSTPTKSKWESMDISRWDTHANVSAAFSIQGGDDEEEEPTKKRHKLSRLSPPLSKNEMSKQLAASRETINDFDGVNDEQRRQFLREIEMKVMKLQDELEASGKTQAEIDSELARYRQKLMIRMDQKLGAKNDNNNSRKESNEKGKESGGMRGNRRSSDEDKNKKERHRDGKEELRERHHREGSEERTRRKDDTRDNKGRHQRDRERNRSRERPRSKNRNQSREDRGRGDKRGYSRSPDRRRR